MLEKNLLINIGNTNTILAKKLQGSFATERFKTNSKNIIGYLKTQNITKIVTSSVVPRGTQQIINYAKSNNIDYKNITHKDVDFDINIKKPNNIGIDRLVNLSGARSLGYKGNILVVDSGTATTFDLLSFDNIFNGGTITTGIDILAKSLKDYTALLPKVDINSNHDLVGKDTISSIQSGIYWSMVSLIDGIIKSYRNKFDTQITVIGTGGGINFLQNDLKQINIIENDLTLHGMMFHVEH